MTFVNRAIWCFMFVSVIECSKINILNSSTVNTLPIAHNHTRRLLEMCFSNRLNPVVITEDLDNIVYGLTDNKEGNISVITIDDKINWWKYGRDSKFIVYPSYPTVILSADSLQDKSSKCFSRRIDIIKDRLTVLNYWRSTTAVLVMGNQYSNASKVLGWLWEKEVLKSYFLCPNEFSNITMIYTMNPFGDRAPKPWKKVETPDKPCDVCRIYKMSFVNDAEICSSLTFDKAEFLNGYDFGNLSYGVLHLRKSKLFYENLWSAMNITPVGFNAARGHLRTPLTDPLPFDDLMKELHNIIPYFEHGGYVIVTQKQSFVPTLDQVINSFLFGKE